MTLDRLTSVYRNAMREDDEPVVHARAMVRAVRQLLHDIRQDDPGDHDAAMDVLLGVAETSATTLDDALTDLLESE